MYRKPEQQYNFICRSALSSTMRTFSILLSELVSDTLLLSSTNSSAMYENSAQNTSYHNKSFLARYRLLYSEYYYEYNYSTDFSCGLEFLGARLYLTLLLTSVYSSKFYYYYEICVAVSFVNIPLLERQRATNWFQSLILLQHYTAELKSSLRSQKACCPFSNLSSTVCQFDVLCPSAFRLKGVSFSQLDTFCLGQIFKISFFSLLFLTVSFKRIRPTLYSKLCIILKDTVQQQRLHVE